MVLNDSVAKFFVFPHQRIHVLVVFFSQLLYGRLELGGFFLVGQILRLLLVRASLRLAGTGNGVASLRKSADEASFSEKGGM